MFGGLIHRYVDPEGHAEAMKLKPLFMVGGIFLASCWFSLTEVRFLIWGQQTKASIVTDFDAMGRERPIRSDKGLVQISFLDGAEQRRHSIPVPPEVPLESMALSVEFIPGSPATPRLAGQHYWGSLAVVGVSGLAVLWLMRGVLAEAREYSSTSRKPRRR